jgi:hypothetical protein
MTAPISTHVEWPVAVLMQRDQLNNRWQRWRWSLRDVLPEAAAGMDCRRTPTCLEWEEEHSQWLYPGWGVQLFRDEAEGYHLNLTSPQPSWFVWWTPAAEPECDDPRHAPQGLPAIQAVTLSYNEAARWMDAGETIEIAPLPAAVANWLADFSSLHYKPEPRKRRRPQSFLAPDERDVSGSRAPSPSADGDDPPACCP